MLRAIMIAMLAWAMSAVPASAQTGYVPLRSVFEGTGGSQWYLILESGRSFTSTDTGWIRSDGYHDSANSNYLAAEKYRGYDYNNWATFDLGDAPISVSGGVLSITTFGGTGDNVPYQLFDVSAPGLLDLNRASGDTGGQALFADLESGQAYSPRLKDGNQIGPGNRISIPLTPAALAEISQGGIFAVGGTVGGAVPEAGTWAMMVLGLGGIGVALRRRGRDRPAPPPEPTAPRGRPRRSGNRMDTSPVP